MECPKCEFEQNDDNVECPACGIVFSRYHEHQSMGGFVPRPPVHEDVYQGDDLFEGDFTEDQLFAPDQKPDLGEDAILLARPTIITIFTWLYALSGIFGGFGLAALGLWSDTPKLVLWGLIYFGLLIILAMSIAAMSRFSWWLLLLTSIPGLVAFPFGTVFYAFFIVFLLRPGTQVLFSGKAPAEVTPREWEEVRALKSSKWEKGLLFGFGAMILISVVLLGGVVAANSELFFDSYRQNTTIRSITRIRNGISIYANAKGRFPSTRDIRTLERLIREQSPGFEIPMDGWDNSFKYYPTRNGFVIVSAGNDGEFEPGPYRAGTTESYACDIVYSSSGWLRYADPGTTPLSAD